MKRVCVYSGSNQGSRPEYRESAILLGKLLAEKEIELVYGGSRIGLMGVVSNEVLRYNGKVTGVMPKGLFAGEIVHKNLTNLIEVKNMHERKQTMADLSDGFICLPGGLGTFEELFEVLSWAQLGIHNKPIGILNISNFFDSLLNMLHKACSEGFMKESNLQLISISDNPELLIKKMKTYVPPKMENKWSELSMK